MVRSYRLEGLVIKRTNFGEADRLLTIFSRKEGKIVVLAKGIRRIKSRRAPHLELLNKVIITLFRGRNFDLVTEATSLDTFTVIKSELYRIAYAYKIIELIDRLCPERESHSDIYQLLVEVLSEIDREITLNMEEMVDNFSLILLNRLGFLPPNKKLAGRALSSFIENLIEQHLKSNSLLSKL